MNYESGSRIRRKFLKFFLNEHVRHKRKLATVCTKFHCNRFSGLEESTVQLNKMYLGVKLRIRQNISKPVFIAHLEHKSSYVLSFTTTIQFLYIFKQTQLL